MKRYTRHGVDAVVLTAAWVALWEGAAGGAAGEGTATVSAVAHGREVSPHAQTDAHTTCLHVLPRSHLSSRAKMKVRLTKSGIVFCLSTEHVTSHSYSREEEDLQIRIGKLPEYLPATAKSKLTQINLSKRAINLL